MVGDLIAFTGHKCRVAHQNPLSQEYKALDVTAGTMAKRVIVIFKVVLVFFIIFFNQLM